MADDSRIEWCDASFNPWWGCAEVSPGCGHCYARTWARFTKAKLQLWPEHGQAATDHGIMVTSDANWRTPLKWARLAREGLLPDGTENVDGHRPRIFTASMADVFEPLLGLDNQRWRLFELIEKTPELDWLVLTKRPDYAKAWLHTGRQATPDEVDNGFELGWVPPYYYDRQDVPLANVWLGTSIENARFNWRADVLREIPAAVRFISAEPLLGSLYDGRRDDDSVRVPVLQGGRHRDDPLSHPGRDGGHSADASDRAASGSLAPESEAPQGDAQVARRRAPLDLTGIDWVIIGGESGPGARPFHLEHAREIVRAARGTKWKFDPALAGRSPAVFVKQLGANPVEELRPDLRDVGRNLFAVEIRDRKGGDLDEWPADLRIREFPRAAVVA